MAHQDDFALIVPLANEAGTLPELHAAIKKALRDLPGVTVYFIVDNASKDNTLELCQQISLNESRFITLYSPANKNVVDAYMAGYSAAYQNGHSFIIEMDGGLSHDPAQLPRFINTLMKGYDCVYGSRFITGGMMSEASFRRKFFSRGGTFLANLLLGTRLADMTSGFQGFRREVVGKFLNYHLMSTGHFYQTELRYLLRRRSVIEVPISYRTTSANISNSSLSNSLSTLFYYFLKRITFKAPHL